MRSTRRADGMMNVEGTPDVTVAQVVSIPSPYCVSAFEYARIHDFNSLPGTVHLYLFITKRAGENLPCLQHQAAEFCFFRYQWAIVVSMDLDFKLLKQKRTT